MGSCDSVSCSINGILSVVSGKPLMVAMFQEADLCFINISACKIIASSTSSTLYKLMQNKIASLTPAWIDPLGPYHVHKVAQRRLHE